jgi:hypothetical protein
MRFNLFLRSCTVSLLLVGQVGSLGKSAAFEIADGNVIDQFKTPEYLPFLVLNVQLQGKMYQFVLDTGASNTCFDSSLIPLLGKELASEEIDTNLGSVKTRIFKCPEARIGRLKFKAGSPVCVVDFKSLREQCGEEVFGLVGMDFLSQYVFRVDRQKEEIVFLHSPGKGIGQRVPLIVEDLRPYVPMRIPCIGTTETVKIDTGAIGYGSGALQLDLFDRLVKTGGIKEAKKSGFATPFGSGSAPAGILEQIGLGGNKLNGLVFRRSEESYIGLNLICRFVVTFDFPHGSMYVKRGRGFEESEFDEPDRSGLSLLRRNGKLTVESVTSGTPGSKAGIRAGDTLESLDGQEASDIHLMSLRRRLCVKGKSLRIVVIGGGGRREVVIKLE